MSFNAAQNCQIDLDLLKEISSKPVTNLSPCLEKEFVSTITKCNNLLTLEPDKLSWRHLKRCVKDITFFRKLIAIANACIELGYWLLYFKVLMSIIIPKSNKKLYDSPKNF